MSFKNSFIAAAVLGLVAIAFQNCSRAVMSGSDSPSTAQSNGTGYGGKVYVVRLSSGLCADGSDILTRIVTIDENTGLKNRDACKDIPGIQVSLAATDVYRSMQINHSPNPYDVLIVGGQIFDLDGQSGRTTRFCYGSARTSEGLLRKSDALIRESAGQLTAYFESAVFDVVNRMVPNSPHYSLVLAPNLVTNGADEYYRGIYGQPPGENFELLISRSTPGSLSGRVFLPSASLDQSGLTCFEAN